MHWIGVLSLSILTACTPSRDLTLTHSLALERQQDGTFLRSSSATQIEHTLTTIEQSLTRIEQSLYRLEYSISRERCR